MILCRAGILNIITGDRPGKGAHPNPECAGYSDAATDRDVAFIALIAGGLQTPDASKCNKKNEFARRECGDTLRGRALRAAGKPPRRRSARVAGALMHYRRGIWKYQQIDT